jgi:hypothetical protein
MVITPVQESASRSVSWLLLQYRRVVGACRGYYSVQESASRSISCYYSNIRQQHLLEYIRYYSSTGRVVRAYHGYYSSTGERHRSISCIILVQESRACWSISCLLLQYRKVVGAYHGYQYRRVAPVRVCQVLLHYRRVVPVGIYHGYYSSTEHCQENTVLLILLQYKITAPI